METAAASSARTWDARPSPPLVRAVQPLVRALSVIHPLRFEGIHRLPRGPALLVGNHGMFGYESLFFFERLLATCGRLPIGLADRWFFRVPFVRNLLVRLGGAYGNTSNGLRALRRGNLVVCYPGGAREVFKCERDKYRLQWRESMGFARLAMLARVPIIPFAAAGVDDTFHVIAHLRGSGRLLMGHDKYDLPLVWGRLGPLPSPVPFWFRFGEPLHAPEGDPNDGGTIQKFHETVWSKTQALLDQLVREWTSAPRPRRST